MTDLNALSDDEFHAVWLDRIETLRVVQEALHAPSENPFLTILNALDQRVQESAKGADARITAMRAHNDQLHAAIDHLQRLTGHKRGDA